MQHDYNILEAYNLKAQKVLRVPSWTIIKEESLTVEAAATNRNDGLRSPPLLPFPPLAVPVLPCFKLLEEWQSIDGLAIRTLYH
jgi:hypothetical protein